MVYLETMRIAGFFLRTLLTLGILVAVVYFFGGQVWLAVSTRGFIDASKDLETSKINLSSYTRRCQSAPAASSYSSPIAIQLRFLDSTHYQTELRCTLIEDTPVIISSGQLPMFISKEPGSSGFIVDFQSPTISTVTLRAFAATKTFTLDTTSQFSDGRSASVSSPVTSCSGWGYMCCNQDQERGSGKAQTEGVLDCSGHCYSACSPLPYIQSFTSDPFPVSENTIRMDTDQLTVTFSYTAAIVGGVPTKVHIDYGDGSGEDSTQSTGSFVHTYSCISSCQNTAVVTAFDSNSNSSVVNSTSTLYIKRY